MSSIDNDSNSAAASSEELTTSGHILSGLSEQCFILVFVGDVRLVWSVALERYCESMFAQGGVSRFYVDLRQASNLDSTTLGVLAKLAMLCKKQLGITAELCLCGDDIERLVQSMGFASVFRMLEPTDAPAYELDGLKQLCGEDCSEAEIKRSVLEAHKTLADMNEDNYNKFKDLIDTLER